MSASFCSVSFCSVSFFPDTIAYAFDKKYADKQDKNPYSMEDCCFNAIKVAGIYAMSLPLLYPSRSPSSMLPVGALALAGWMEVPIYKFISNMLKKNSLSLERDWVYKGLLIAITFCLTSTSTCIVDNLLHKKEISQISLYELKKFCYSFARYYLLSIITGIFFKCLQEQKQHN